MLTGKILPDPARSWVRGTMYEEPSDEYSSDGTLIGVGTNVRTTAARACGVTFASPLPPWPDKIADFDSIFEEYFAAI
jgi:hypothetical protein